MPLKAGKKAMKGNIKEMMGEYTNGNGKIGNVKPKNKGNAIKIAVAAAYQKAGKSKKK